MINKKQLEEMLVGADVLYPICIPSYKRWERNKNKTITRIIENCDEEIQRNTYVFVREEQYKEYKNNFNSINIVTLPKVNGLASTRQFITDYVSEELKQPYFMDMDDDITDLKAVFLNENGKPSLSKVGEIDVSQIIKLGFLVSEIAFKEYNCLFGGFRRVRFANNIENTQTAFVTNKGATPRQVMFVNADGLKRKKIHRNMIFDPTGDDVGFVAEISKNFGEMFNIPFLAYSFVDDTVNSVIRNDDNRKILAEYEETCIRKYPMRNYMRIPFTFEDGSYKFCDIDFTKYRKVTGLCSKTVKLEDVYKSLKKRGKI